MNAILLIGAQDGTFDFTIPKSPIRKKIKGLPAFTTVKGGAYFFLPGIKALNYQRVDLLRLSRVLAGDHDQFRRCAILKGRLHDGACLHFGLQSHRRIGRAGRWQAQGRRTIAREVRSAVFRRSCDLNDF